MTNISATSLKLRNSMQKILGKQTNKKLKSVKTEVVRFITKQYVHASFVCLYRNKVLLDIIYTELCSLITNVYKPSKDFDFAENQPFFRFAWFEEFSLVCYSR